MPANLPPQYYEVEKTLRAAKSPEERIAILEEMLAIMPKHKGTDHLRAELRSRIAKLTQSAAKKSGAHRASMSIEKEGDQIRVLVADNGVGFDPGELSPAVDGTDRFGLFSIRERLDPLGGHVHVESEPGRGTRVTLMGPLGRTPSSKD